MKELAGIADHYYNENPDDEAKLIDNKGNWEWCLFKSNCIYESYIQSKNIYIKNIETIDRKWSKIFNVFLSKRGNKTKFNYKWIKNNIPDVSDDDIIDFIAFLQVLGFLKISEAHQDIRKRGYELPILYKPSPRYEL